MARRDQQFEDVTVRLPISLAGGGRHQGEAARRSSERRTMPGATIVS